MNTLYEAVIKRGIEHGSHASDLYLIANQETFTLLKQYQKRGELFTSDTDGKQWFDVPFAYDPWWDKADKTIETWAHGVSND